MKPIARINGFTNLFIIQKGSTETTIACSDHPTKSMKAQKYITLGVIV